MIDEPYRWLEAVANRREYIRDQLKSATPVFAFSRPEGILLFGVGSGQSKIFEIYDRHAFGALGHPVDIERIRQTLIEAAHIEGFARSSEDVTLRRLLNFALGPLLKTSFEQILGAPLIVESILAEIGLSPAQDVLARMSYDGTHHFLHNGIAVAHTDANVEKEATDWLAKELKPDLPLADVVVRARQAWHQFGGGGTSTEPLSEGRVVELGLLDRRATGRAFFRALDPVSLS